MVVTIRTTSLFTFDSTWCWVTHNQRISTYPLIRTVLHSLNNTNAQPRSFDFQLERSFCRLYIDEIYWNPCILIILECRKLIRKLKSRFCGSLKLWNEPSNDLKTVIVKLHRATSLLSRSLLVKSGLSKPTNSKKHQITVK